MLVELYIAQHETLQEFADKAASLSQTKKRTVLAKFGNKLLKVSPQSSPRDVLITYE